MPTSTAPTWPAPASAAAPSRPAPAPPPSPTGDLTPQLRAAGTWTDEMVAAAGIPVLDVPIVSVGGGIGSFALVDLLRTAGVPLHDLAVLTDLDVPWQTYEYLTRVSQIPREERLRSDSSGMPDNPWGFPSYALQEAWRERTLAPLWSVLTEPVLTDYWTPRAGTVFRGLEREAQRIGYHQVVRRGRARMVRRRWGGGWFTVLTPAAGTGATTPRVAFRSRHVHLAVGYPGLRFLPDLQELRARTGDATRVVNAYEPHEHVYETTTRRPCTVLVRGGGIVSSRVLQRLCDDRAALGLHTNVVQLMRTYVGGPQGTGIGRRRPGRDGFAHQGFNVPKASWGGQLKDRLEKLDGEERAAMLRTIGGTHTPRRRRWQRQLADGRREGWYTAMQGVVEHVDQAADGRVVTTIASANGARTELVADFVIDATGLEADLSEHRLLGDLLEHAGAGRNPLGRLDVGPTFEVTGTRNEPGRLYASGSMTAGCAYAGVDSFLGLQYAALCIADDLAALGVGERLGPARSVAQWWRWVRNRPVD